MMWNRAVTLLQFVASMLISLSTVLYAFWQETKFSNNYSSHDCENCPTWLSPGGSSCVKNAFILDIHPIDTSRPQKQSDQNGIIYTRLI